MVKLGIVTAEAVMVSDKGKGMVPAVVIIGRDENNKKLKWRGKFWPYIYLGEADYVRAKAEKIINFDYYVIDTSGTDTRTLGRQPLTKLYLKDSKYVASFVHALSKTNKVELDNSMWSYEADLSTPGFLAARFLIDKGLRSGVDVVDTEQGPRLYPIDMSPKLRRWYIDFEALSAKRGGGGPKKEEPIPIVSFYDSYDDCLYTLYARNKNWKVQPVFYPIVNMMGCKEKIECYDNEGLLLEALCNKVVEKDPDIITAWNLDRYDIIKWVDRMRENHLDPGKLSPFNVFGWKKPPYRIKGRILFDLMKAFKRFTDAELVSYNLGAVAKEEGIAIEKVQFKASTQWLWDNEPEVMFNRNVTDVLVMLALDRKYELIEMFDDLRKEFGVLFNEVLLNYRVLDTALMRMVNGKVALRTAFKGQKTTTDKLLGAVVVEAVPGLYHFIAQFDFNREYPSLIKAFNIGPETYIDEEKSKTFKGECFTITYRDRVFRFKKNPQSLLARLIDQFFSKRNDYEECYRQAVKAKDEVLIKAWHRKIFNVKKMTNAIYGVMDFPSFRLYNPNCTQATAILGRLSIEELGRFLAGISYKLLYGDTDSIFLPLKATTNEEAVAEGKELEEKVNQHLSEFFKLTYGVELPAHMGLKKVYDSFLLLAKKNYAGRSFWDEKKGYKREYDFKGLEVVRSDSSEFEKEVVSKIVHMVLDGQQADIQGVRDDALLKVSSRTLNPLTVSYPLQISDPLKNYPSPDKNGRPQMPAHIRAALVSNSYLGSDFDFGDKPRRLPILESKRVKMEAGQKTLFNDVGAYLPSSHSVVFRYKYKLKNEDGKVIKDVDEERTFVFKVKDISINEDLEVSKSLMGRIDWGKIGRRLDKKIDRIMKAMKGVVVEEEEDVDSKLVL